MSNTAFSMVKPYKKIVAVHLPLLLSRKYVIWRLMEQSFCMWAQSDRDTISRGYITISVGMNCMKVVNILLLWHIWEHRSFFLNDYSDLVNLLKSAIKVQRVSTLINEKIVRTCYLLIVLWSSSDSIFGMIHTVLLMVLQPMITI